MDRCCWVGLIIMLDAVGGPLEASRYLLIDRAFFTMRRGKIDLRSHSHRMYSEYIPVA